MHQSGQCHITITPVNDCGALRRLEIATWFFSRRKLCIRVPSAVCQSVSKKNVFPPPQPHVIIPPSQMFVGKALNDAKPFIHAGWSTVVF